MVFLWVVIPPAYHSMLKVQNYINSVVDAGERAAKTVGEHFERQVQVEEVHRSFRMAASVDAKHGCIIPEITRQSRLYLHRRVVQLTRQRRGIYSKGINEHAMKKALYSILLILLVAAPAAV